MEKLLEQYKETRKKLAALNYAFFLIGWDSETEAPKGCFEHRSEMIGVLSEEEFKTSTSPEYIKVVNELFAHSDQLDDLMQREIKKVKKDLDKQLKVPMNEYVEFSMLLAKSQNVWAEAKVTNDFSKFAPYLEKIIVFQKKMMKYYETPEVKGFDVILDNFEEGATEAFYDNFFDTLKRDLVPFVKQVTSRNLPAEHKLDNLLFDKTRQKEFSKYLMDVLAFDQDRGLIKESEHPFTSGAGTTEVRVTTHYYEDNLFSNIFSVIHELGHATYEQQVNPILDDTTLGGGATMAMHESQSRFFENILGRSYAFWQAHYPKLQEIFKEELKNVTLDDFYQLVNVSKRTLIRTEADELTYPLHIMVRYDIEKALFENKLKVEDLPKAWSKLMKDYLDVEVPSDKEGVLQDIHWAGGMFGYFPTYALGSAIGAQIYSVMQKELDVDAILLQGNTKPINDWLKEHIHQYGGSKTPNEMLLMLMNEKFNPQYYITYLKNKYSKIYNIPLN